jgi:pimeloyl-ACP methyl ester carboxylesterase
MPVTGDSVPAILQLPSSDEQVPAVLLLHGFSSRKERMADSIGRSLAARRVASLAIDLPLHGARDAGFEGLSFQNPVAVIQNWRRAIREADASLAYLEAHDAIDRRRIGIAGYSLGAYLATAVAADKPLARAVALAAGGDLPPQLPFASLVRTVADPRRAVRNLAGRPLLMVNGRFDRTIRPEQATALFDAADEPKELQWYEGGHWPPQSAIDAVADWLAEKLSS